MPLMAKKMMKVAKKKKKRKSGFEQALSLLSVLLLLLGPSCPTDTHRDVAPPRCQGKLRHGTGLGQPTPPAPSPLWSHPARGWVEARGEAENQRHAEDTHVRISSSLPGAGKADNRARCQAVTEPRRQRHAPRQHQDRLVQRRHLQPWDTSRGRCHHHEGHPDQRGSWLCQMGGCRADRERVTHTSP